MTQLELKMPLIPPGAPIGQWFDRVFLSPWVRWDALWYQRIVTQGYSASDGTTQFHPLYPWLTLPLVRLGIFPTASLLIISSLAGIALYYSFFKLSRYDLSLPDALYALFLFALAPPAFILFAPYSEAVFLLCAVLCFIFIRTKTWWLAGIMGGLATLTRQQGLVLFIPLAWELWEASDRNPANLRKYWRDWLALGFIPLGLIIWLVYRYIILNDLHPKLSSFQDFLYSIVISPSATKVVPMQRFIWPWQALYLSLLKIIKQADIDIWVNILGALVFVIILVFVWKKISISYRLYSLVIAGVSFSYYTGPVHPYMGLLRHLFLAFPIFIGIAALVKNRWIRLLIISLSGIGMLFLIVLYVLQAWVV